MPPRVRPALLPCLLLAVTLPGVAHAQVAALPGPATATVELPGGTTPTLSAAPTGIVARKTTTVALGITGRVGVGGYAAFPVDGTRAEADGRAQMATRLRARLDAVSGKFSEVWTIATALGVDVLDGTPVGGPKLEGDQLPGSRMEGALLQDAWVGVQRDRSFGVRVGAMTSHWGMGLVAHDGGQGFSLGRNDWFTQNRSGDRVLRAAVYGMPLLRTESAARGLWLSAAVDRVIDDDTARWADGERATQAVAAARLYLAERQWFGLYYVHRAQRHDDGKSLDVDVVDAAFDVDRRDEAGTGVRLEGEGAWIVGTTTLAPSPEHPSHRVEQLGAAGRVTWQAACPLTLQLDGAYLSGDANLDDGKVQAFHADRNFRQGLVLFPTVLAWQTGRARLRASDPILVGVPAEDLDRLASGGAVFDAVTLFPKLGWRLGDRGEVYAGLLLAWAPAPLVDPYGTRVQGGGQPRTYLGTPADGRLLGAEVDAGARWRWPLPEPWRATLQLGVEAGHLLPGGALGDNMPAVTAGWLTLALLGR